MSFKEVVGCLKVHEERFHGYDDKEELKHLLLTYEEWLVWTKRNDAADSSFSGTNGHGGHNKESRGHGLGHGRCGDYTDEESVILWSSKHIDTRFHFISK